ncbi:type-F conjugative transfer system protein TraW [Pseudoduganella violacea]|uniref:Conjugal transfer pilus assembly protein TraW n=1 Tax=Pseudoduganella violacea TaxID=1715466 RepID=A0A7W5BG05_9BURK|nr:type-F conjugative transfer system protein TraW [Pseudoduganella violacea]MBB3122170.1 conjugal transfer pilus assembly protein TraW [Pseudoduganella violacea]
MLVPLSRAVPLLVVSALGVVRADTLATIGPTYAIGEEHLLAMITRRLREKEASGELQRLQQQIVARGRQAVLQPPPLALPVASTPRTFYHDPTYVLAQRIVDAKGAVLFPAGTRSNPLDIVPLRRRLLFFDGRDARQVALAERLQARYAGALKPVLTGGAYLELMRRWQRPVYYDQQGALTRRLHITRVPALVSQEGRRLRIDELVPEPVAPATDKEAP